jgi:hypothetical protein
VAYGDSKSQSGFLPDRFQESNIARLQEQVMREQNYLDGAKLNPARTFKTPMDVVETDDIDPAAKLAILKAWEADERALLRAEDEGMGGGEHAHLHKVQAALAQLRKERCSTGATQQAPAWP